MPELMANATPGTGHTMSDSGWSNNGVFLKFLKEHFLPRVQRSPGEKVLVLFDGHKSHICPEVRAWAAANDVILFLLPPHTSHKLQPLNVSCYSPLKSKYKKVQIHFAMLYNYENIDSFAIYL